MLAQLPALPDGVTVAAQRARRGVALDFIRGNLFDRRAHEAAARRPSPGPDNDLADKLAALRRARHRRPDDRVYAFGERWGPEADKPDKIFGFRPGNGVHDIHMNQGNSGRFVERRRRLAGRRAAAALPHRRSVGRRSSSRSRRQPWHTDDVTGHTIARAGPATRQAASEPDRRLRIVAALVNPIGPAPESETVTLINPGADPIDLTGWSLVDRQQHVMPLDPGVIGPGDAVRLALRLPVQLGNSGGLLTLLDPDGLKVDGIAYTREQVRDEGRTLIF